MEARGYPRWLEREEHRLLSEESLPLFREKRMPFSPEKSPQDKILYRRFSIQK